ncbi:MAG: hypothetical protein H6739_40030 [Alphaproteobacteria bacterium]|nr:hypothetical protein [Alphaproteobacteria bacterium]
MSAIELLLHARIVITLVTCVGPMLATPGRLVMRLYDVDQRAIPLVRLYGVALTALLVGYASGVLDVHDGRVAQGPPSRRHLRRHRARPDRGRHRAGGLDATARRRGGGSGLIPRGSRGLQLVNDTVDIGTTEE